ncbi:unnamed protein product [Pedinophyceae sp. YPF-701]|nr:unnamed protein product [Pedinophyceae sp. YPF-701]
MRVLPVSGRATQARTVPVTAPLRTRVARAGTVVRASDSPSEPDLSATEKDSTLSATEKDSTLSKLTAAINKSPINAGKKLLAGLQAGDYDKAAVRAEIDDAIAQNKVVVFSWSFCPFCVRAKQLLDDIGANYKAIELDQFPGSKGGTGIMFQRGYKGNALRAELAEMTDRTSMPNVFIGGVSYGGCNDGPGIVTLHDEGRLVPMLKELGAIAA